MSGRRIPAAMVLGLLTVAGGSVFLSIHGNTLPAAPPPVTALPALTVPAPAVPRPTLAKFQAVREGMSKPEVLELLGPPTFTYEHSGRSSLSSSYSWDIVQPDFRGSVQVSFEFYHVVSKAQWGLR